MSSYDSIIDSLNDQLVVEKMYLENESSMHNVPANSETHFKLVIVSDNFIEMTKVKRHQLIYAEIQEEIDGPIHALSIHTFTEQEWKEKNEKAEASRKLPSAEC